MSPKHYHIIGSPIQEGASQAGCLMGPDALRTAGLIDVLKELGHQVTDAGNARLDSFKQYTHPNEAIKNLSEVANWAKNLQNIARSACTFCDVPIFLGGDHSMSIGTVSGVTEYAKSLGQPQYVLWLDAHPDMHSLSSTKSGNLHGTPINYLLGRDGFDNIYPKLAAPIEPENLCFIGLRSVDVSERELINELPIETYDMRRIDEIGIKSALKSFLERVHTDKGRLHVSFDVDFLDPSIAPAVGTTVPGGATFREAHLVMEMLFESELVTSIDMVELNPFLDERGRTAQLMVDLCASLTGRNVLDRPTTRY
jgi:arginase